MKYYIADTHFNDNRIINLCNRPFATLKEMTNTICKNWNSAVDQNDEIFILGDFALKYTEDLSDIIDSLNGRKTLVPGNHDSELLGNASFREKMNISNLITTIKDDGRSVTLCHYPMVAFEGSLCNGYHVYGHVHNNYNEPNYGMLKLLKNSFNAGVDVNGFKPISLNEAIHRRNAE